MSSGPRLTISLPSWPPGPITMPMTYTTGPSLTGACFRSLEDASKVFYAAARGVLPLCSDRLNEAERKQVRPGNVYVYDSTALVRWADGRRWGASRVRGFFLCYPEKSSRNRYDLKNPLTRVACTANVTLPNGQIRQWGMVLYLDNSSPLTPVGDIPNVGDTHVPPGRVVITQGSQQGSELHAYFVPAVNVRRLQANSH